MCVYQSNDNTQTHNQYKNPRIPISCIIYDVFLIVVFSFGDMRVEMSQHVSTVWLALDAHKLSFIPRIVATVLEMSLVKQKG